MPHVRAIHLSAVKSLRLGQTERAELTRSGIAGDRAFVVLDEQNQVATLRKYGWMAQVGSRYDPVSRRLELDLPDGGTATGTVEENGRQTVLMFGRPLRGRIVAGPWAEALSAGGGAPAERPPGGGGPGQGGHPA